MGMKGEKLGAAKGRGKVSSFMASWIIWVNNQICEL
jgi:hypothetical protein